MLLYKTQPQPITVFHHIAKTAGSTLRLVFKQYYDQDEMLFVDNARHKPEMERLLGSPSELARLKLVYGHEAFGFFHAYEGPVRLITWVRNPFARLVSQYYYSRRVGNNYLHQEAMRMPLEDFALVGDQDDYLARLLSLPNRPELNPPPNERRGLLYDTCMQNLRERISFVGITERFDESIVLLRRRMGWHRMPVYAPILVNDKSKRPPDIEEKRAGLEKTHLAIDKLLYDYCVRRFEEEWNSRLEENMAELEELRRIQATVELLLAEREETFRQLLQENGIRITI